MRVNSYFLLPRVTEEGYSRFHLDEVHQSSDRCRETARRRVLYLCYVPLAKILRPLPNPPLIKARGLIFLASPRSRGGTEGGEFLTFARGLMYRTYLKNAVSHILQKESSPQFDRLDALL